MRLDAFMDVPEMLVERREPLVEVGTRTRISFELATTLYSYHFV